MQGFGNVGSYAAETLAERGVKLIGVSDHTACYFDPRGLDAAALLKHAQEHGVLAGFSNQLSFDPRELLAQKCDVLVPAAMERVIDASVAARLQCRVLAEAANGPTTPDADLVLNQRRDEIFVIPDVLCNAGGVVVSYFEWVQDLQQFFWDESGGDEQALPRAGSRVYPGDAPRRSRQGAASHGGHGDRRGEGAQREEHARAVPVSMTQRRSASTRST